MPLVRSTFFCECARAARPQFTLDATSAPAVAGLCRRLDGLPLALELAAAQLRFFGPAALLAHLEQHRTTDLGRHVTATDRPERHRTVGATIAYSHDLLSRADQVVFRRLGVFAGSVPIEAIAAVVPDPSDVDRSPDVYGPMTRLALAGLVRVERDSVRFSMLDTIRDYAKSRLEAAGEEDALRRRHLSWYRDVTVSAWDAVNFGGDDTKRTVATEVADEVRAALGFAFGAARDDAVVTAGADMLAAVALQWTHAGAAAEAHHWLDAALVALPAEDDSGRRAELTRLRTYRLILEGNAAAAVTELRRLLDLSPSDDLLAARVHLMLGLGLDASGEYESAAQEFLLAVEHADRIGAMGLATSGRVNASDAALDARQYDVALTLATQLLDFVAERGLPVDLVYFTVASCACAKLDRLGPAADYLSRGLAFLRENNTSDRFDMRLTLMKAGATLAAAVGRPADAARLGGWWNAWCRASGIDTDAGGVYARMGLPAAEWDALRAQVPADKWQRATDEGAGVSFDECRALIEDAIGLAAERAVAG